MMEACHWPLFVLGVWQFTHLVEWCLHTLSHARINLPLLREIHRIHMEHHKAHYPVGRLLRPPPYSDGGGALAFGPIVAAVLLSAYAVLPSDTHFAVFAAESLTLLRVSTYLHDQ